MEERERKRTGIASLKIRYNQVFGYYIEISKPNLALVPADYERKQTLVNAERFTSRRAERYERKVLTAEERVLEIERRLYGEIRESIAREAGSGCGASAAAIAQLDVLVNFARIAAARNYTRPEFTETSSRAKKGARGELMIAGGRHPVIEKLLEERGERFVPNDLYLGDDSPFLLMITGPNMGGKSTYLRQAALISILAQMGSFVPAAQAKLPLLDRIFTRIGASDNLARGRSTFLVEMSEVAAILNTATPASLVLLDEVGRGTATFDGLSIAWAVVESLHGGARPRTLFATHYHELTELEQLLPGVKNVHVSVEEAGSEIVFLRRVEPGSADKSYGIEVARLAGLPSDVIARAREILRRHEQSEEKLTRRAFARSAATQGSASRAADELHGNRRIGARSAARSGSEPTDAARGAESARGTAKTVSSEGDGHDDDARAMRVLGMMSGTSADGIDVALVRISGRAAASRGEARSASSTFPSAAYVRESDSAAGQRRSDHHRGNQRIELSARRRIRAGGDRGVQEMARAARRKCR